MSGINISLPKVNLPHIPQPALPPAAVKAIVDTVNAAKIAVTQTAKASEIVTEDTLNAVAKAASDNRNSGTVPDHDETGIDDGQSTGDETDTDNPVNPDDLSNPGSSTLNPAGPLIIDPNAGQPSMQQGNGAEPATGHSCTTLSTDPACQPGAANPAEDLPEKEQGPPEVVTVPAR